MHRYFPESLLLCERARPRFRPIEGDWLNSDCDRTLVIKWCFNNTIISRDDELQNAGVWTTKSYMYELYPAFWLVCPFCVQYIVDFTLESSNGHYFKQTFYVSFQTGSKTNLIHLIALCLLSDFIMPSTILQPKRAIRTIGRKQW